MLGGWYCRTLANEQANMRHSQQDDDENDQNNADSGSDDSQDATPSNSENINRPTDYKTQYKYLKQKIQYLIYENEFFQDALRTSQRRLLKISRDRSFLLDRLLQYEKPEGSSSESEETESSDESSKVETKKRKYDNNSQGTSKNHSGTKKRKITQQKTKSLQNVHAMNQSPSQSKQSPQIQESHNMTTDEVERHLQSRQSISELVSDRAPPTTVPTEMFSNEPSLDSESNDQMIETSPSNIGEDCVSVDMNMKSEYNINTT